MSFTFTAVGTRATIPAGKQIIKNGTPARQTRPSEVTIVKAEPARRGKTRIYWKSMGYLNSTLV